MDAHFRDYAEAIITRFSSVYLSPFNSEADKKLRLGEEGAKPKRIRYKPITR